MDVRVTGRRLSRVAFLRLLGAGGAATALAACAAPTPTPAPPKPTEAAKPPPAEPRPEGTRPTAAATKPAEPATAASPPPPTAPPAAKPVAAAEPAAAATKPASAAGTPKRGGTLRVGLSQDATTMDPHFSGSAIDRQIYFNTVEALVGLGPRLELLPSLAESWQTPDPTTYLFQLRKGVKFHDGTDFDAAAAKFNFDRILDPEQKSPRRGEIASVKSVDVVDQYTLKMSLTSPDAALLATLTDRSGMIISPESVKKFGKDLARNVVGTGPYRFVEWQKDSHILLQRFDQYWNKDLPYLDAIRYRVILDNSVKIAALKNKELDVVDYTRPQGFVQTKDDPNLDTVEVPDLGAWWLWLNATRPPFDKKPLRQAVAAALDLDAIVKAVFLGLGVPANGPIPPSSWAYDRSIAARKRDPALAKAKLADGGQPSGFKFSFETENIPLTIQVAQLMKAQLAEVGIDMEVTPVEVGIWISHAGSKSFEAGWSRWSGRPDPDGNTFAHFHSKGTLNIGGYANAKVDEALEMSRRVSDREERKKHFAEVVRGLQEDAPVVFIWHPVEPKAMAKRVKGYPPVPDGMMRFASVWLE